MEYAQLGATGIQVSRLAFGAGPVAAVMIGTDADAQRELVRGVLDAGINWIDTAAGYGDGRAEQALGSALAALGARQQVHIATKVRLADDQLNDVARSIRESVVGSLQRLQIDRVTLLQLHNSITEHRGDEPDSITPREILGLNGIADTFDRLRDEGVADLLGITAIGHSVPLHEVIDSGRFDTIQVPYNLVNPSAGQDAPADFYEADYGNAIECAATHGMGVFAIRVLAGGVLSGNPPSQHTLTTKYFPLDLFERDQLRVDRLRAMLGKEIDMKELAVRFSLSHPHVSSAIIGFSEPNHVREMTAYVKAGPLPQPLLHELRAFEYR